MNTIAGPVIEETQEAQEDLTGVIWEAQMVEDRATVDARQEILKTDLVTKAAAGTDRSQDMEIHESRKMLTGALLCP